nr:hypothetical protein [Akkermansia muciniphila]
MAAVVEGWIGDFGAIGAFRRLSGGGNAMAAMIPDKIKAGKAFMERMMKNSALSVKEEAEFSTGVS